MKTQVIIFAVLCALAQCEIFNRPCRTLEEYGGVKKDFRPEEYLNRWYEIERYDQPFQRNLDCVTATYSINATDGSIIVDNRAKSLETLVVSNDIGRALISFPDEIPLRAMLNVSFADGNADRSNYWVISTNYTDYAVVVSCSSLPLNRSFESYWLLSRTSTLSVFTRIVVDSIINRFIDVSRVRVTDQTPTRCT